MFTQLYLDQGRENVLLCAVSAEFCADDGKQVSQISKRFFFFFTFGTIFKFRNFGNTVWLLLCSLAFYWSKVTSQIPAQSFKKCVFVGCLTETLLKLLQKLQELSFVVWMDTSSKPSFTELWNRHQYQPQNSWLVVQSFWALKESSCVSARRMTAAFLGIAALV